MRNIYLGWKIYYKLVILIIIIIILTKTITIRIKIRITIINIIVLTGKKAKPIIKIVDFTWLTNLANKYINFLKSFILSR